MCYKTYIILKTDNYHKTDNFFAKLLDTKKNKSFNHLVIEWWRMNIECLIRKSVSKNLKKVS